MLVITRGCVEGSDESSRPSGLVNRTGDQFTQVLKKAPKAWIRTPGTPGTGVHRVPGAPALVMGQYLTSPNRCWKQVCLWAF